MVGLPDSTNDRRNTRTTLALAVRWPLAALLLALIVYALLRPWNPPGAGDAGLPGAVAGSKVVEEVEVRGSEPDEETGTTSAPTSSFPGTTSFGTPLTDAGFAPTLVSFTTPVAPRERAATRQTPEDTRNPLGPRPTPAADKPLRPKADEKPARSRGKSARKADTAARHAARAAHGARTQGHTGGGKPAHANSAGAAPPAHTRARTTRTHVPAAGNGGRNHGQSVAQAAKKNGHGKAHGKSKKHR